MCLSNIATNLLISSQGHPIVTDDSDPRNKNQTLQQCFSAQVESFKKEDGPIADAATAQKTIHHIAMEDFIVARGS